MFYYVKLPPCRGAYASCLSWYGLSRNPSQITVTQLQFKSNNNSNNNYFLKKSVQCEKAICSVKTTSQIFQVKQGISPYNSHCIDQELHGQTFLFGLKYSTTAAIFNFTFLPIPIFNQFSPALCCVQYSHILEVWKYATKKLTHYETLHQQIKSIVLHRNTQAQSLTQRPHPCAVNGMLPMYSNLSSQEEFFVICHLYKDQDLGLTTLQTTSSSTSTGCLRLKPPFCPPSFFGLDNGGQGGNGRGGG